MKVYKVLFENNVAVSAIPKFYLHHGDVSLKADRETVQWIALECEDKQTALEIASRVVNMIWGHC